MVILSSNRLEFSFPEVHAEAHCSIEFKRTLRIPDDNRKYHLPPGLGTFPLFHVEDFQKTTPEHWQERGGVFLPIFQAEALWIRFSGYYPCAVKIAAGKINAITGNAWQDPLDGNPQDYVVSPDQLWLDGFCISKGLVRQFIAMPFGAGYTAEEQLTGKAEFGGLQICVCPLAASRYESFDCCVNGILGDIKQTDSMGLAPGGLMRQEIYEDGYGLDAWDQSAMSRCFVHLANSEQFLNITGHAPPTKPITAKQYSDAGLPWFEYYSADKVALKGAKKLARLDSLAAKAVKLGAKLNDNEFVEPKRIVSLGPKGQVSDGQWLPIREGATMPMTTQELAEYFEVSNYKINDMLRIAGLQKKESFPELHWEVTDKGKFYVKNKKWAPKILPLLEEQLDSEQEFGQTEGDKKYHKTCINCFKSKPYYEFGESKRHPGKLTKWCKSCLSDL